MTDKLREKAQQALGALEAAGYGGSYAAIELREALDEQAEQEPVGVVEGSGEWGIAGVLVAGIPIGTKLYAAPVRTKDLTDDEERQIITTTVEGVTTAELVLFKAVARAVIAADREKNNV